MCLTVLKLGVFKRTSVCRPLPPTLPDIQVVRMALRAASGFGDGTALVPPAKPRGHPCVWQWLLMPERPESSLANLWGPCVACSSRVAVLGRTDIF